MLCRDDQREMLTPLEDEESANDLMNGINCNQPFLTPTVRN
jgi:hypothetical protein